MSDKTPEQEFAAALAAFQAGVPTVTKDAQGQVGNQKTRYADLASIAEAAYPKLAEHGLSYLAKPTLDDGAFVLRYALLHVGGHREGGSFPLPASATSQQMGSAITYARRYCLLAVTGIAPKDDDDDGAKGSEVQTTVLPRAPRRTNATTRKSAEDLRAEPDEWATPSLPVTDAQWLEDFRRRLVMADKPSLINGLDEEAHVQFAAGNLTAEDAKTLKGEIDIRRDELKGEPVSA
jgi:hypothetical protein